MNPHSAPSADGLRLPTPVTVDGAGLLSVAFDWEPAEPALPTRDALRAGPAEV